MKSIAVDLSNFNGEAGEFSFTKFNSKEINRGVFELSDKGFSTYMTVNSMIVKYNHQNKFRQLSINDIFQALPYRCSTPTLKRYLDELRDKGFIKSFQDVETKHHVYSLINPCLEENKGYTKVDDFILEDIFSKLEKPDLIKLYLLIFLGVTAFAKHNASGDPKSEEAEVEIFTKTLRDLCQLMGKKPSKGNRDAVARNLSILKDLGLINYSEEQKHIFLKKKISITLEFFWGARDFKFPVLLEKAQRNDALIRKFERHDVKVSTTRCESFDDIYIKKETIFKNQNISKKESSQAEQSRFTECGEALQEKEKNIDSIDLDNFDFFNFYGLDQKKNPLTVFSLKGLLKKTKLNLVQIQDSLERFVGVADFENGKIKDPVAFFCGHLLKVGEYFPAFVAGGDELVEGVDQVESVKADDAVKSSGEESKTTAAKEKIIKKENFSQSKAETEVETKIKLNFDFDFCGFDSHRFLKNPLNFNSINRILKENKLTPSLTVKQVQISLRRFCQYLRSDFYEFGVEKKSIAKILNPAAFFCQHLIEFGEWVPPEEFLTAHRLENQESFVSKSEEGRGTTFVEIVDLIKSDLKKQGEGESDSEKLAKTSPLKDLVPFDFPKKNGAKNLKCAELSGIFGEMLGFLETRKPSGICEGIRS